MNLEAFKLANPSYNLIDWPTIRSEMHHLTLMYIDGSNVAKDYPMQIFVRDENDNATFLATVRWMAQGCYNVSLSFSSRTNICIG